MRNPPLIQLGRHFLTYVGATPFYVAAHNGDAPYMRLLAEHGADPKMPNVLGITPLIAAAGLDYWEGEAPGPFTGVTEAERLEAVKLALDLGNDINAAADFGDYQMEGDPALHAAVLSAEYGSVDGKSHGRPALERQHGAAWRGGFRAAGDRAVSGGSRRQARCENQDWMDPADAGGRRVLCQRQEGLSRRGGDPQESDDRARPDGLGFGALTVGA